MTAHTVRIQIEDGSLYFRMTCPYTERDLSLECWPRTEENEPYPAPTECNYIGWAENMMPDEWHRGLVEIDCDAALDWTNGDYPLLVLANPRNVDRGETE